MVAILEFVIVHVPPAVVEVAVMVPPTQSVVAVAVIGFIVGAPTTTACTADLVQPLAPVTV